MSQKSCTEEEVRHSNLVSAPRANRPLVATVKATWYFLNSVWPWECPGIYERHGPVLSHWAPGRLTVQIRNRRP